jgi:hypothetical protein
MGSSIDSRFLPHYVATIRHFKSHGGKHMGLAFLRVLLCATVLLTASVRAEDKNWTEKVDLGMDFRYRHEMQDVEGSTLGARHRQRIRARLWLSGEVDENLKLHLRLMTGNSTEMKTIVSGNETLDDNGAKDPFYVDMAYAAWNPTESNQVWLGKFGTPFYRPSKSQLIWDNDFTPEGVTYSNKYKSDSYSSFLHLGAFWMDENNNPNDTQDHGIVGIQVGSEIKLGEPKLIITLGHYNFVNFKDAALVGGSDGGNSTYNNGTRDAYLFDYQLYEAAIEIQADIAEMPSSVYVNAVENQDPDQENMGFIAGFKIGKIKEAGDWEFIYNYRKVEKDAVIGSLADSNFSDGDSDAKGHTLAIIYGLTNNSDLALAYFDAERALSSAAPTGYQRAHVDFSFKF